MGRNKLVLGVIILILIAGLFIVFKRTPSDSQKIHAFQQRFLAIQVPLNVSVAEFERSYNNARGSHALQVVYIDAMRLNESSQLALKQINTTLGVPTLKNKVAQANLQQAHDVYVAYVKAFIPVTQNVINLSLHSGFVAQLPPLMVPSINNVTQNIASAYLVLNKSK